MLRLPPSLSAVYRPATDREVHSWSYGAVKARRVPNAASWEARRFTLDDQMIFGPLQDYQCACGKYRGDRYRGMICDRCGVKLTTREARHRRFGHIDLPEPVPHPVGEATDLLSAVPVLPASFRECSGGKQLTSVYEDLVRFAAVAAQGRLARALERLAEFLLPVAAIAHEWGLTEATTLAHGLALEDRATSADGRCVQCGYPLEGLHVVACPRCGKPLSSGR